MRVAMATTIDNPYDPFDQFKEWYAYDTQHGYNTCAYMDRLTHTADAMSEREVNDEIESVVDEIVSMNLNGLYVKVCKEVDDPE